MVDEKGLKEEVADKIGTFVLYKGDPLTLHQKLLDENVFGTHTRANQALEEMKTLFSYLEAMGTLHAVSFDLSLARGLDYYTGMLTYARTHTHTSPPGDRYGNLIGTFPQFTLTPTLPHIYIYTHTHPGVILEAVLTAKDSVAGSIAATTISLAHSPPIYTYTHLHTHTHTHIYL